MPTEACPDLSEIHHDLLDAEGQASALRPFEWACEVAKTALNTFVKQIQDPETAQATLLKAGAVAAYIALRK